jgi:spermidine synthase
MTKTPIYQTHDPLGQIEVYEENGVRHLNFGSFAMQSAVGLNHAKQLHFAYTQTMMGALLFQDIEDDDILLMGLGGGSLAKYFFDHFPLCRIEAIEYREVVAQIAYDYFDLPRDSRLNVVIDDAAHYARERCVMQREFYRLIMLDLFDAEGISPSLFNETFLTQCQSMLKKEGILVVNLWNNKVKIEPMLTWLGHLYQKKLLFLPVHGMVNTIGFFFHEDTPLYSRKALQKRAIQLEKRYQLPFKRYLKEFIAYNSHFIDNVTSA